MRSVGSGVFLQEVQTLSSRLQGNISHGSRLFEIPCEQTGFVRTVARWILLLQEFNYEVVIKSGKANSNADYLFRQRGEESVADISAEFPDDFPDLSDIVVFYLNNEVDSEFQDIINYLVRSEFPDHFTREEKEVFQRKMASYSLIKGILFKLGADEQLRCGNTDSNFFWF
jgi:hypothetical protein